MKSYLFRSVAVAALIVPTAVAAQSSGTVDFEEETIVVTGSRNTGVAGVIAPDTAKAKAVLTQEFISRQNPGQTILDTINQIPSVNFQNNDAYGSSGGTLTIRGFAADRVSVTFDGIPLNDSGNYAVYSNQMLDPELIDEVNVNMGATDVDSPTASAAGGTVNYRTIKPSSDFGARLTGSYGEFNMMRIFGVLHTGEFTPFGTRAFVSASTTSNDNPFNNYGRVNKQQYNARIYQPIGSGDDFISLAAHYNQNRNNFFGSLPLRWDTTQSILNTAPRIVGSGNTNRYPMNNDEREYDINYPCNTATTVRPNVADAATTCGTEFDRRYNPSNTGNIRAGSRFSLTERLVFTLDGSVQFVKANGGGTVTARETGYDINPALVGTTARSNCATTPNGPAVTCAPGYFGGSPYFGRDLNGDGDVLDSVTMIAPSQTKTRRYVAIAGMRYDLNDDHVVRLAYTFDRARHRQTGEVGLLQANGEPFDVFPVNAGQADVSGATLQKRDRLSFAILHQLSGEYRGEFMDNRLKISAGVRAPFFKRELNQNCWTTSAGGFIDCFNAAAAPTYGTLNPTAKAPQSRVYKYDAILPGAGFTFDFMPKASVFGSVTKGISVPGTDPLYNSLFFASTVDGVKPVPEKTTNYDLGLRFRSGDLQAQFTAWMIDYKNRLASAYDPELNETVYRNLGSVRKKGIEGSISYKPVPELSLYAFGSLLDSKIKNDVAISPVTIGGVTYSTAPTAGKFEAGQAKYSFGGTVRGELGPVSVGLTAKRTGPRYIYDTNLPVYARFQTSPVGVTPVQYVNNQVFGAKAPAYTLVNLDARVSLEAIGLNDKSFFQLNVYNLFDKFYVGGFGGNLFQTNVYDLQSSTPSPTTPNPGSVPFVQVGAPRTISGTVSLAF